MKAAWIFFIALTTFVGGLAIGLSITHDKIVPVKVDGAVVRDTTAIHDTIRAEVPKPIVRDTGRIDTVRVYKYKDSSVKLTHGLQMDSTGNILIPIERKIYLTKEYKATVDGYRTDLVSMELYTKTTTIHETVNKMKSPRWAVTIGPGVGYDGSRVRPYIGATVGYVLWSK